MILKRIRVCNPENVYESYIMYETFKGNRSNRYCGFEELITYCKEYEGLTEDEVKFAINEMIKNTHDAASFGVNGFFIATGMFNNDTGGIE